MDELQRLIDWVVNEAVKSFDGDVEASVYMALDEAVGEGIYTDQVWGSDETAIAIERVAALV